MPRHATPCLSIRVSYQLAKTQLRFESSSRTCGYNALYSVYLLRLVIQSSHAKHRPSADTRRAVSEVKSILVVLLVSLFLLPACDAPLSPVDEAKVHLQQGNIYLKQEAWGNAVGEFNIAIDLDPELEQEARVGRGIANAWTGNFELADSDFNRAIDLDFGRFTLITTEAAAAWGIALTAQGTYEDLEAAEGWFDHAIFRNPNNPDAYAGRALLNLKQAQRDTIKPDSEGFHLLSDAVSDFEKAIGLDPKGIQGRIKRFNFKGDMAFLPKYIEANNLYGAVWVGGYRSYYDKALTAYDRVFNVAPENVQALFGQGVAYLGLGRYGEAIAKFNRVIGFVPGNADAYAGRGIAYGKREDYPSAVRDFEKAVELDGRYLNGSYLKGKVNKAFATPPPHEGQSNSIDFASSYLTSYSGRGNAFLIQQSYEIAVIDFTKAIDLYEEMDGDIYYELSCIAARIGRGIAYERKGEYNKAIDDLTWHSAERSVQEYLGAAGRIARAISYSLTGQDSRALEDFRSAAMYVNFSMDADAYFARGYAYKIHGRDYAKRAIADFKKFIALAPGNPRVEEAERYINELTPPPPEKAFFEEGNYYLAKGNWEQAADEYSQATKANPSFAAAYANRAVAYNQMDGRYESAIADAEIARKLDPFVKLDPSLDLALAIREVEQARVLDPLVKSDSWLALAYVQLGRSQYIDVGHSWHDPGYGFEEEWYALKKAVTSYTKAINLDLSLKAAYEGRADSYVRFYSDHEGMDFGWSPAYETVIADYTTVISLSPKDATLYYKRYWAHHLSYQSYGKELADIGKAIELDPANADYYDNRGRVYLEIGFEGFYDLAIGDFTDSIKLDPTNYSSYWGRAEAYVGKKDLDSAIRDYTRAIEFSTAWAVGASYAYRGSVYIAKKDYDAAIADFTKAIEFGGFYFTDRASAYLARHDYDLAIADASKAIVLSPQDDAAYWMRGQAYAAVGQNDKAQVDFQQCLTLSESREEYDDLVLERNNLIRQRMQDMQLR